MASSTAKQGSSCTEDKKKPLCILVLGMAGSGKTRFVQQLDSQLSTRNLPHNVINLDPAVHSVPYSPYIDIRDTVNYKEIMKQHELGPNGGIVTSLNLFSTMFHEVMNLIQKKEDTLDYLIIDTPGQIEVFNWSASGPIIAGSLASTYPTIVVYVMDTPRSSSPQTFMSNMLYACSILYKYKLPFIIAMNKIDIMSCDFAMTWMQDFEEFQDALSSQTSYVSNLTSTLCIALEEFYTNIKSCGISAVTGEGYDKLLEMINAGAIEFEEYRAEYNKLKSLQTSESSKQDAKDKKKKEEPGLCSIRKAIRDETEIYMSHNPESSDDDQIDEDDTEEKKELESFQNFLKMHIDKTDQQLKRNHPAEEA